jgi:hypothetical protein
MCADGSGEWSGEMAYLDWIKERIRDVPKVTPADRALFAEWRQDHQMAKQRDETGKEPERIAPDPAPKQTVRRPTPSWER